MDEWRVIKTPPASVADVFGPFATYAGAQNFIATNLPAGNCCLWLIRHPNPDHRRRPLALPAPDVYV